MFLLINLTTKPGMAGSLVTVPQQWFGFASWGIRMHTSAKEMFNLGPVSERSFERRTEL
jgi:hypothetical protein